MSYKVTCEGATAAQLEAAKAAADKVFANAGMEPWEGFEGRGSLESYDDHFNDQEHRPTDAQQRAADVYFAASAAANKAIPGCKVAFLEWVSDNPEEDAKVLAEMRAYIAKGRATHEGKN